MWLLPASLFGHLVALLYRLLPALLFRDDLAHFVGDRLAAFMRDFVADLVWHLLAVGVRHHVADFLRNRPALGVRHLVARLHWHLLALFNLDLIALFGSGAAFNWDLFADGVLLDLDVGLLDEGLLDILTLESMVKTSLEAKFLGEVTSHQRSSTNGSNQGCSSNGAQCRYRSSNGAQTRYRAFLPGDCFRRSTTLFFGTFGQLLQSSHVHVLNFLLREFFDRPAKPFPLPLHQVALDPHQLLGPSSHFPAKAIANSTRKDNSANSGASSSTNNSRLDSSSTKYCSSSCKRSFLPSFKRLFFNISDLHLINSTPLPLGGLRLGVALFLPLGSTVRHLITLLDPLLVARLCVVDAADLVVLGGALLRRLRVALLFRLVLALLGVFSLALFQELVVTLIFMFCATLLSLHYLAELLVLSFALGIVLGLTRCAVLRLALVLQLLPTHLFRRSLAMRLSDVFKLDVAFWSLGLLLPMISHPRQEAGTCTCHKYGE